MPGPRLIRLASDARLVTLVREGRAGAFEAVYDRHHRGILSFCRHMLGDQHEAEDALQHTFMAAYSSLLASQQPIQLRPWLFAIARNRCYTLLRSQRERPTAELDEPLTDGLAAEVQRREDLRDLVSDLNRLPDEQRAAIVLAELESLSHAEIADVLDVPRDKVKALVFQARESLLASRTARDTSCHEIREELAIGRGAALRRGNLRRHLRDCEGCRAYRAQVQHQRRQFGLLLPIGPAILAKEGLLAAAVGAGGAAAVGGSGLIASSALKTGVLKGIAAAVIAGVGTVGTVVVSASDLPVRSLAGSASSHPGHAHGARPAGHAAVTGSHTSSTGSSLASVQLQSSTGVASRAPATRVTRRHGQSATGRHAAVSTHRHRGGSGHRHGGATSDRHVAAAAPGRGRSATPIPGQGRSAHAAPGHVSSHVPPGRAQRSLADLPPGQAKKLAPAVSSGPSHAAVMPRTHPAHVWAHAAGAHHGWPHTAGVAPGPGHGHAYGHGHR